MSEKRSHHNVAKALRKFATLIGKVQETPVVLGNREAVVPGLGLTILADALLDQVAWLEGGCLRLAVVGAVSRGKSTLVNALVGASCLPVDIEACTGVITQVVYGSNVDEVTVVEDGERRTLRQEAFLNTIRLTPEEQGTLWSGEAFLLPERLTRIDYAVLESEHLLGEKGLHIVDTLGFRAGRKAEEITKAFLAKTDALVFVTRAQPLFEEADQKFLETQLRLNASRLEHIFFVINDFSGLNEEERAEVMATARVRLKDYFLTPYGAFDEGLFKRRVFIVNARDALKAKLEGETEDSLKATGLPDLEHAIEEMLSEEEVLPLALEAATVQVLIPACDEASRSITQEKVLLSKDLSELERTHRETEGQLAALTEQAYDIQDTFDAFAERIGERAADHFEGYITRMMDRWKDTWDAWDVGYYTIAEMISGVRKDNREVFAASIENNLQSHFATEMSIWESEVFDHLRSDIEEMSAALEAHTHRFVVGLGKVQASMIDQAVPEISHMDEGLLKRITSAFTGTLDSNLISEKLMGVSVRRIIWHIVLPVGILGAAITTVLVTPLSVVALPILGLPAILMNPPGSNPQRDRLPEYAFNRMRDAIGKALREELTNSMPAMQSNIRTAISDQFKVSAEKFLGALQAEVEQVMAQLESTVSKKRVGEAKVTSEISRLDVIAEHLDRLFKQVSHEVYGRELTDAELQRLHQGSALLNEDA